MKQSTSVVSSAFFVLCLVISNVPSNPANAQHEVAELIFHQNQLRRTCKKIDENKSALTKLKNELSIIELNGAIVRKQMAQLEQEGKATEIIHANGQVFGFETEAYSTLKDRSGNWFNHSQRIGREIQSVESRLFFLDGDKKRHMEDVARWTERVKKLFPKKPPGDTPNFGPKVKKIDKDVDDAAERVKRAEKKVGDLSDEVNAGKKLVARLRGRFNSARNRNPRVPGEPPAGPRTINDDLLKLLQAPKFTLFGGFNRLRVDGQLLGVTNFGVNNAPVAGTDKTTLSGGSIGIQLEDLQLGGPPNGGDLTFNFKIDYTFARHSGNSFTTPPGGSNALLFPVTGGGAIGLNGPVRARIKTNFWRLAGLAGLTYWHHRNPNSHLGYFVLLGLSHAVLTKNSLINANNLAFGNLDHAYHIRRTVLLGSLLFGLKGKRPLARWLFLSGSVYAGLSYVNGRLTARSCLDIAPAPGCDGLFSTASTGSSKAFVAPSFGITAALTAVFACSDRARLLGACALATLEAGYSNSPFVKTTHQTTLGSTLGLRRGRLQNFHAMLKISIPLSILAGGR